MEAADLTVWLGKPPATQSTLRSTSEDVHAGPDQAPTTRERSPSPLNSFPDAIELAPNSNSGSDDGSIIFNGSRAGSDPSVPVTEHPRHVLRVNVPEISHQTKGQYAHAPGHFVVEKILAKTENDRWLVRLQSREVEALTTEGLREFESGTDALSAYESTMRSSARLVQKPQMGDLVNWNDLQLSELDTDDEVEPRRKIRKILEDDSVEAVDMLTNSDMSVASDESDPTPAGRRSSRLAGRTRKSMFEAGELSEYDSLPRDARLRRRQPMSTKKSGSELESRLPARRSERTRIMPKRSMRERHEDEISSASEEEVGPKILTAKEHFYKLPQDDPFRRYHRANCDTCDRNDKDDSKGPLIFCQGCSNAHHKVCLGPRGSRDHLVTKVGDTLFVLQCRKCIGTAHEKDGLAPHLGHCTACSEPGPLANPFRSRLTTRQEQLQREENEGVDPITRVDPGLLNKTDNVMFRCASCQRAWHMHHLPNRKTISSEQDEGEEKSLTETQLAQKRFEHYHRSWTCKDCLENQHAIDALVAWRPTNIDEYVPGTSVGMTSESHKEYLVKWRAHSYFRVTWMPGSWVWAIAASAMRAAFLKKPENSLPKMTTKDAIPEDFFRVDIVFDVHYTSVVRNSSKEIDMVRAKEVDSALVKYRGLGYEDVIWEKPPAYNDGERWNDFKSAYEDYVTKVYMAIPPQSSLRRHLLNVRTQEFDALARKTQPTFLVGGELMKYQLEGLNWLYWQWYRSHNAILADEMGLGKTIQLIAFFANLIQEHKCWPFLVVVPNSTCPNWRREIKKWAPAIRVVTYYGSERARRLTHDYELFPKDKEPEAEKDSTQPRRRSEVKDVKAHIVITSYESISEDKTRKSLMRVPWQGLIVDEGQRLKSDKNLVYESLSKFNFPFKVLLTGTPLQNNARELFNLLQFLDKSKNAAELEEQYAQLTAENVPELHELLRPFFLRRTKVQVLTFLPPMAQIIVPITMSTVQRRVYKSILAQNPRLMKAIFSRTGIATKDRINLNNILMQLRRTLCHPFVYSRKIEERTTDQEAAHRGLVEASAKLQLLQVMLPKLQERGHRVLMFSQFLDNLDIMEDFLDGLGMLHRRLDGTINALEKQKRIDEFNAPDSPYFAFLLSTRAGGVGINLATADTVIILDPDFNPHQDIQALSRAHRIGQKHKVLVFQLMVKSSAEEKIMAIGKKKMALDHVLIERMDNDEDAGGNLESILSFGAEALFDEQSEDDKIVYDAASVEKLLDRSQIESTKTSDDQSAESQFSYARVWANDKSSFEEGMEDVEDMRPSNLGIWDKILADREKAFEEEQARKAETFGRGKRRRGHIEYNVNPQDIFGRGAQDDEASDEDFNTGSSAASAADSDAKSASESEVNIPSPPRKVRTRPFKRVKVPSGPAPHFDGEVALNYVPMGPMPPVNRCLACHEDHPIGWCRLKVAGVEHCGLCGLAHIGHGRTCPHLHDEKQVEILLATLKESTEATALIDDARRYLTLIRSHLVSQRKKREAEEKARAEQSQRTTKFRIEQGDKPGGNNVRNTAGSRSTDTRVRPGQDTSLSTAINSLTNIVNAAASSLNGKP